MKILNGEAILGDCLEEMKNIPDGSIDMILCDLPYGTTRNKWDSIIPLDKLWEQYNRIIKDNGAIVLTAQTPFDKVLGASNLEMLRYEWIWEKTSATGHLNAKKMPMKAHENILVFYKNSPVYNPQKTFGHERKVSTAEHKRNSKKTENYGEHGLTGYDSTERYPRSVLKLATDKQKQALHPTQKPVALFKYLIRTYTVPGMTILDNCSGSGTMQIGVEELNILPEYLGNPLKWISIEKEQEYFDIGLKRITNHQYHD